MDALLDVFHLGQRLRHEHEFCAASDAAIEGDEPGIATHYLDEKQPVVPGGRVADSVVIFDGGVQRRVKADRLVGAEQVVVDGAGATDGWNTLLIVEERRAPKCAVATDADEALNTC